MTATGALKVIEGRNRISDSRLNLDELAKEKRQLLLSLIKTQPDALK
ncbi:MAG: hypothetical protein ACJAQT_000410 [Akkermansiaceae bacterium]|jgi:hypothetical protein